MLTKSATVDRSRCLSVVLHSMHVWVTLFYIVSQFPEQGDSHDDTPGANDDIQEDIRTNIPTDSLASTTDTYHQDMPRQYINQRARRLWWHRNAISFLDATVDLSHHLRRGSKEIFWAMESPHKMTQYLMNKTATFGKYVSYWSRWYYNNNNNNNNVNQDEISDQNDTVDDKQSSTQLTYDNNEEYVTFPILQDYPSDMLNEIDSDSDIRADNIMDGGVFGSEFLNYEGPLRSIYIKMQEMLYTLSGNPNRVKQERFVDNLQAALFRVNARANINDSDNNNNKDDKITRVSDDMDGKVLNANSNIDPFTDFLNFHSDELNKSSWLSFPRIEEYDEMDQFSTSNSDLSSSSNGEPPIDFSSLHNTIDNNHPSLSNHNPNLNSNEDPNMFTRVFSGQQSVINGTNTTNNPDDFVYVRLDGRDRYCHNGAMVFRHPHKFSGTNIMNQNGIVRCMYLQLNGNNSMEYITLNTSINRFMHKFSRNERIRKNCSIRLSAVECLCSYDAQLLSDRSNNVKARSSCIYVAPRCTTTVHGVFTRHDKVMPYTYSSIYSNGYYRASRSDNLTATFRIKCTMEDYSPEILTTSHYIETQGIPNKDKNGKEIRYTLIVNGTVARGISFLYRNTLPQVTNVTLDSIRRSPVVFNYLYRYNSNEYITRENKAFIFTSHHYIFYSATKVDASLKTAAEKLRSWQLRFMKGMYFYSQFFNFYHLSDTTHDEIVYIFQLGGAPMPGPNDTALHPIRSLTNWTQVGNVLNGIELLDYTINLKELFNNDEFFTGGRLHSEFGFKGFYTYHNTVTLIIDITDPPIGKFKVRPNVIPVPIILGCVILIIVIIALVVNVIKRYQNNKVREKDEQEKDDLNIALFDEK